jgi:hypothetical protein
MNGTVQKTWKTRGWTWGKRLFLTVLVLGFLMYGFLSLAQQWAEPIRKGLEDNITQMTGNPAQITDMIEARFVPNMVAHGRGLLVRDGKNPDRTLVAAEEFYISMPFWRVLFGRQGYVGIDVKNLDIASGFYLPRKVSIAHAGIAGSQDPAVRPHFFIDGMYNDAPLLITAEMQKIDGRGGPLYRFADVIPLTFKIGGLESTALYRRGLVDVALENGHILLNGGAVDFSIENMDGPASEWVISGILRGVPFEGFLEETPLGYRLNIKIEETDSAKNASIATFLKDIQAVLGLKTREDGLALRLNGQDLQEKAVDETQL